MFETHPVGLEEILKSAARGSLQLPDFQRDYVWEDSDVQSLIASVAKGFPVGALLTLETGGDVSFKPRPIVGVESNNEDPDELLLDGQQRITTLYQAMYSNKPVRTLSHQKKKIKRYYYLSIEDVINGIENFEDSIVAVPEGKVIKKMFGRDVEIDLTSRESEFEQNMFPLNMVFDSRDWLYDWRDYWRGKDVDVSDVDRRFVNAVIKKVEKYKMPVIRLKEGNTREGICLVFEKVNVGGKKLDAFELLTAIFAAEEFDLRVDWMGSKKEGKEGRLSRIIGDPKRNVVSKLASTDFLQACTLLHTRDRRLREAEAGKTGRELPQVSCNREALLSLPLGAYKKYADTVEKGFVEAAGFLNGLKIIWYKDIPYPPQVVALAATFAILGKEARTATAKNKIEQWFWSVTLGELYGSSTDSRLARDVPELVEWIRGEGEPPRSIGEATFQRDRLHSLRSRLSAAYKGLHALIMQSGCQDFISGKPTDIMTFFNEQIDIHHIFPRSWCKKRKIEPSVYDSIINKTPLSKLSNIAVGGRAPSEYLKRIEEGQGIPADVLDDILRSHLIEPKYLRNDDFEGFYEARMNALADLVAKAMKKPVIDTREPDDGEEYEPDLTDLETDSDEFLEAI